MEARRPYHRGVPSPRACTQRNNAVIEDFTRGLDQKELPTEVERRVGAVMHDIRMSAPIEYLQADTVRVESNDDSLVQKGQAQQEVPSPPSKEPMEERCGRRSPCPIAARGRPAEPQVPRRPGKSPRRFNN